MLRLGTNSNEQNGSVSLGITVLSVRVTVFSFAEIVTPGDGFSTPVLPFTGVLQGF